MAIIHTELFGLLVVAIVQINMYVHGVKGLHVKNVPVVITGNVRTWERTYVGTYMGARTYVRAWVHVRTYVRTWVHVRTWVRTYVRTWVLVCTYVRTWVHVRTYVRTWVRVRRYMGARK